MKTKLSFSLALASVCFAAMTLAARAAPPPPPPGPPAPKILVVDRTALFEQSKAGQDIMRQVKGYTDAAERDLKSRSAALEAEGQALQQQVAILSADAKTKKVQDFETKQRNLQGLAQQKQAMIQGGFLKARTQLEQLLGPILQGILQQRGGNMILDKNAVVFSNNGAFDITGAAINALNQKITTIKVELVAAPSGAMPASAQR